MNCYCGSLVLTIDVQFNGREDFCPDIFDNLVKNKQNRVL